MKSVFRKHSSRAGLSLVEIMVAMLVLAALALAAMMFVRRGQIDVGAQFYKRAAIEAANNRMEEVVWANPNTASVATNINSTVALNGISGFAMTTTITNMGVSADNCFKITVSVAYINGDSDSRVQLETYRSK